MRVLKEAPDNKETMSNNNPRPKTIATNLSELTSDNYSESINYIIRIFVEKNINNANAIKTCYEKSPLPQRTLITRNALKLLGVKYWEFVPYPEFDKNSVEKELKELINNKLNLVDRAKKTLNNDNIEIKAKLKDFKESNGLPLPSFNCTNYMINWDGFTAAVIDKWVSAMHWDEICFQNNVFMQILKNSLFNKTCPLANTNNFFTIYNAYARQCISLDLAKDTKDNIIFNQSLYNQDDKSIEKILKVYSDNFNKNEIKAEFFGESLSLNEVSKRELKKRQKKAMMNIIDKKDKSSTDNNITTTKFNAIKDKIKPWKDIEYTLNSKGINNTKEDDDITGYAANERAKPINKSIKKIIDDFDKTAIDELRDFLSKSKISNALGITVNKN